MDSSHIQVIDRAFDLIEQLSTSDTSLTISELSQRTLLPKSTVHRILNTLSHRHYIEKDPQTNRYALGHKFVQIASIYLNKIVLCTEAAPIMHKLATMFDAISYLGVLENAEVVYLEKIEKHNNIRQYSQIGKREPVYCTALGKVLLSPLNEEEFETVMQSIEFVNFTPNTITSKAMLAKEVENVRVNGYALDMGEHVAHNFCLAMPIYDYTNKIIAAISLSGDYLFRSHSLEELKRKLTEAARRISQKMGHKAQD